MEVLWPASRGGLGWNRGPHMREQRCSSAPWPSAHPPAAWTTALMLAGRRAAPRGGTAHADAAAALFAFAAAYALSQWEQSRVNGWLAAGGLLAGLAGSAKLLGVAALIAWTVVLLWKTRRPREALIFAGAGLLMIGPWLGTTWSSTGDPVWPFLGNGRETAELAARYLRSNRWDFPPPASVFTHDGPGFLILPALGLLALSLGRRPAATAPERWLWMATPAYAALAWRHNEAWRFLMPVWPALALAAGRAAAGAFTGGRKRRVAAAALALISALPTARRARTTPVRGARPAFDRRRRRASAVHRAQRRHRGFYRERARPSARAKVPCFARCAAMAPASTISGATR